MGGNNQDVVWNLKSYLKFPKQGNLGLSMKYREHANEYLHLMPLGINHKYHLETITTSYIFHVIQLQAVISKYSNN